MLRVLLMIAGFFFNQRHQRRDGQRFSDHSSGDVPIRH